MQNKVIGKEKNEDVKHRVGATACRVSKGLKRNQLSKGRIEKVNKRNNFLFWHKSSDSGREVSIIKADSVPNMAYFCAKFKENGACTPHKIGR